MSYIYTFKLKNDASGNKDKTMSSQYKMAAARPALSQKVNVIGSTTSSSCVESVVIVSQSAQKGTILLHYTLLLI